MYPLWGIFIYSEKKHNDILNADKESNLRGCRFVNQGMAVALFFNEISSEVGLTIADDTQY